MVVEVGQNWKAKDDGSFILHIIGISPNSEFVWVDTGGGNYPVTKARSNLEAYYTLIVPDFEVGKKYIVTGGSSDVVRLVEQELEDGVFLLSYLDKYNDNKKGYYVTTSSEFHYYKEVK